MAISIRHETARRYAEAGIAVFPCRVGSKEPATAHGFHDATTDLVQIDAWWAEADYNIGMEPERAGWCVIDLDTKANGPDNWLALMDEHGIDPTYAVATATPGSMHLVYAGSLPPTASKLGPGIDTRGRGSYVLVPPSVVNGVEYKVIDNGWEEPQPLPAWIAEQLGAERERATAPDIDLDLPDNIDRARVRLRMLVAAGDVAIDGQGGDDRTYRLAAELLSLGLSPDAACALLEQEWNPHCEPPWDSEELLLKVENAARYGQNAPGSWAQSQGIPEAWQAGAEANPPTAFPPFRPWATIKNAHFEPPQWVWQDRLLAFEPNLYTGDAGVGKTTLAENIAVAVACGASLLGQSTRLMPVALLVAEDHYGPVRDNLAAIAQALGVADHSRLNAIHILSVKSDRVPGGHLLARIGDDGTRTDSRFLTEAVAPFLRSLRGECLLVIDPLTEFVAFNNLSDQACRALATNLLADVCALNGGRVTVLVNDHPSKAGMAAGHHYAGSVQLKAAFSLMATLIGGEWSHKQRKLSFVVKKGRYAAEDKVDFYRTDSAAFSTEGMPGANPREHAQRVYSHVMQRCKDGLATGRDNRSDYGPGAIAHEMALEQREVERALSYCRGQGWLVYTQGSKENRTPASWAPGHVFPLPGADEPSY